MSEKEFKLANTLQEVAAKKEQLKDSNKKAKQEPKKPVAVKPLVHIDKFIEAIAPTYNLSGMQMSGFKAYMSGNHYLKTLQEFVPYLDKYLGRKDDSK